MQYSEHHASTSETAEEHPSFSKTGTYYSQPYEMRKKRDKVNN